MCQGIDMLV